MKFDVEELIGKLEVLNDTYLWSIQEAKKIVDETEKLIKSEDPKKFSKIDKLRNKFLELQTRHINDKALYNRLIAQSRSYFLKKYNTDIIKLLGDEE